MVFLSLPFEKSVKCAFFGNVVVESNEIRQYVASYLGSNDFTLYNNGKILQEQQTVPQDATIHVAFSLPGGKGGFGSMLRAIGAQIEKTTNREACRDLSGRRLRDINEEQRLKKWISKEAEREAEKVRRRKARIERLKTKPTHKFVDFEYEREISELPERIDDALNQGMQKSSKRPPEEVEASSSAGKGPSKKKRLWIDDGLSGSDSDSQEASTSTFIHSSQKGNAETMRSEASGSEASDNSSSSDAQVSTVAGNSTEDDEGSRKFYLNDNGEGSSDYVADGNIPSDVKEMDSCDVPQVLTTLEESMSSNEDATASCSSLVIENFKDPPMNVDNDKKLHSSQEFSTSDLKEKTDPLPAKVIEHEDIDLLAYESVSELESLGLESLKWALMVRGLKCGGSITDRALRLWKVRGLQPHQYPANLLAKNKK